MGDRFSEDPFVLFQLRGRNRARLLEDLAEHRRKALAERAATAKEENKASTSEEATPLPPHAAVQDPALWWRYNRSLDGDLVVITPAMDGDTGLDAAGELPLAEDPRFSDARSTFLSNLKAHGQASAQKAMLQAMAAGG